MFVAVVTVGSARQGTIVSRPSGVPLPESLCRDGTITAGKCGGGGYLLDMLWQRTTLCVQSVLLELEVEPNESRPAELERYGGGLSPSNTVLFGGARMHFW